VGSHYEFLKRINAQLAALDLLPLEIVKADAFLKPIDVLEMLNAGIIEFSITENHLCKLWKGIFPNLEFYDPPSYESERGIAWIVRKGNPQLKTSLNNFIRDHKKGTLHGNIYFRRYFKNVRWIKNPLSADDRARFSRYTPLFKKYGARYGFDWMLIAAVAYQESGLNPLRRSPAGAVGMMQVMPATAKSPRIGIDNPHWLENNVHAGARYLALLRDTYFSDPEISSEEQIYFVLAAYNAGPGKIRQARFLAGRMGYDPNRWFHHTELGVMELIGQETVRYVSNVNKYYLAYSLSSTLDCLKNRNLIFK
jgi:membrane-bound lytic murein transglycosylase MltF